MGETGSATTFVFAGGLHRSGTSLVCRCLAEHPLIGPFAGADDDDHRQIRDGLDSASFLTEQSPAATRQTADELFARWSREWDLGRPYRVVRAPENLVRTRFLQALFPESRFVMVMRHPIAVAGAMRASTPLSDLELIAHWLICHERLLADVPGVRHLNLVRYEDLVAHPEQVLPGVFRLLGLDTPPEVTKSVLQHSNELYFDAWQRRRSSWRRRRSYDEIIAALEARVTRFGYSLANPGERVFCDRAVDALAPAA